MRSFTLNHDSRHYQRQVRVASTDVVYERVSRLPVK